MILLIDNYDSFTYNLFQYVSELGKDVKVVRNDCITLEEIKQLNPEAIILSPGPGIPQEAGICVDVVKHLSADFSILGICLGHQAIGVAFGGTVVHAKQIKHGKTSLIKHVGDGIFSSFEEPIEVMRYHSLIISQKEFPPELDVMATSIDDSEVMAVKHHTLPVYGMQFHPESIGTEVGKQLLDNYFKTIKKETNYETIS